MIFPIQEIYGVDTINNAKCSETVVLLAHGILRLMELMQGYWESFTKTMVSVVTFG